MVLSVVGESHDARGWSVATATSRELARWPHGSESWRSPGRGRLPGFAAVNEQMAGVCGEGQVVTERSVSVGLRDLPDKAQGVAIDHVGVSGLGRGNVRVLNSGSGVVVDKGLVRSMKAVVAGPGRSSHQASPELSIWYASVLSPGRGNFAGRRGRERADSWRLLRGAVCGRKAAAIGLGDRPRVGQVLGIVVVGIAGPVAER